MWLILTLVEDQAAKTTRKGASMGVVWNNRVKQYQARFQGAHLGFFRSVADAKVVLAAAKGLPREQRQVLIDSQRAQFSKKGLPLTGCESVFFQDE
jgi:hypothetical protein